MPRTEGHYIKKGGFSVKSNTFFDRLTVGVAAILLFSLFLSLCLLPKKDFSSTERRALTPFPSFSAESVINGRFFDDLADFCTDQFPLRERFTALVASTEHTLGKQENNGILFCREGYLVARGEYDDLSVATANLTAIRTLADTTSLPTTVCILPRTVDVLTSALPRGYDTARTDEIHARILQILPDNTDLKAAMQAAATNGEQMFYRTDHHWTTAGAYLAYTQLAPSLGIEAYAPEHFTPTPICDIFLGTSFARAGLSDTVPDTITLYRYAGDTAYAVKNGETGEEMHGFYNMDALSEDDPYEVFLGGNFARLSVTDTANTDKPTLLLVKDSFANSLVPFLALHFQLVLVDPRYEQESVRSILDEVSPDRVLILLGADTVATTPAIKRLGR